VRFESVFALNGDSTSTRDTCGGVDGQRTATNVVPSETTCVEAISGRLGGNWRVPASITDPAGARSVGAGGGAGGCVTSYGIDERKPTESDDGIVLRLQDTIGVGRITRRARVC